MPDNVDQFIALPHDRQISTLQKLSPDMQQQLLGEVKSRRQKAKQTTGVLRPLTEQEQLETVYPVGTHGETLKENVHNILRNAFTGAYGVLAHPGATVGSILKSVIPAPIEKPVFGTETPNPVQSTYEGLSTRPGETISVGAGQAAAMPIIGRLAEEGISAIPKIGGRVTEAITKTGPRETAGLVKETQAANVEAATKAAAENAKLAQEHLDKTIDALHETKGSELQYQQAVKAAQDAAQEAQRALDAEHAEAVQKALQDTREKEDLYQADLRKAKAESEEAYQQKLKEVEQKRAKAEQDRKEEFHKYFSKKAKAQSAFQDAMEKYKTETGKQEKIGPTKQKLDEASSELRGRIETAREKALKTGNEKYSTVNTSLNPIEADPEAIQGALVDATESLKGSHAEPTLIRSMTAKFERNEPWTYEDLQGDYSRLGKELSKGTLHGDEFHAYDVLHEAIGKEMQRIADSEGMGAHLADARNYWRLMKQTFGKKLPMTDAATAALKEASPDFVSAEEQANRIRLLGNFDSRIPEVARHIENLQKGVESLPEPVPKRTLLRTLAAAREPLPAPPAGKPPIPEPEPVAPKEITPPPRVEIPERPAPVEAKMPEPPKRVAPPERPKEIVPERKTIGPEQIREAKAKSLRDRAEWIRHRGMWAASWPVFYALKDILHGNIGAIPGAMGEAAATAFAIDRVSAFLQNPKVVEFLTRPTAKDIAQIPPDLRADITQLAKIAAKKGMKVDPRLYAVTGATQPKKSVGDILRQK